MLCGVGGRTVAEAKQRISYDEFLMWMAYRRRYGPLTAARRIETSLAMLMLQNNGGKAKLADFLPFSTPEPEREIDLETAKREWE